MNAHTKKSHAANKWETHRFTGLAGPTPTNPVQPLEHSKEETEACLRLAGPEHQLFM